ncbi:hypothetical protein A2U01_0081600, partial [Trifolium medium]|nr:hypothetical protein [Trifolium medium]
MCRIVWKWCVGPINRGQISSSSPSEHVLTADRNLLAGARNFLAWCSPSETFLAQR